MTRLIPLALAAVALAACGCKSAPATSTIEHSDEVAGKHDDHGDLPPAVAAFHDRLAPLWHAAPGPARTEDTCGSTGELDLLLEDLETAGAPAGVDAGGWSEAVTALRTAWADLGADCIDGGGRDFEARFGAAHDRFHALLDLLPKHGS